MSAETLATYSNKEVIAVNQETGCLQGYLEQMFIEDLDFTRIYHIYMCIYIYMYIYIYVYIYTDIDGSLNVEVSFFGHL